MNTPSLVGIDTQEFSLPEEWNWLQNAKRELAQYPDGSRIHEIDAAFSQFSVLYACLNAGNKAPGVLRTYFELKGAIGDMLFRQKMCHTRYFDIKLRIYYQFRFSDILRGDYSCSTDSHNS